ncbi:MAG: SDR family oxidoreductase [Candidatus Hodarchaeota archaeon]
MRLLITGANRGLGFVRQYLERGDEVIATCRRPNEAKELHKLANQYKNMLSIQELDVSSRDSINSTFVEINQLFSSLDLLINNAGIISGGCNRYHAFGKLHTEDLCKVFQINTFGPVLTMEKFVPLLKKGKNPKIVNISSRMGSLSLKRGTSTYSYDASKAALNMFSKAIAYKLKTEKISVLILYSGWAKTDMGTSRAPLKLEISVKGMIKVIDSSDLSDTGKFYDWDGNEVPW